jgi:hypothetical protein
MTVLQRKEATGVDSARLAKMVGSVALIGAIGLGVGFALTSVDRVETVAPAEIGSQVQGLAKSAQANQSLNGAAAATAIGAQGLAKSAEANQALNGAAAANAIGAQGLAKSAQTNQALNGASVASVTGPFLAGHPSQTHKGRNGVAPAAQVEWSAVGDPISTRIPDYPQSTTGSAGTSGEASGFGNGDMFAR